MKALALALCVTGAITGVAYADCKSEIEKTRSDWAALKLEPKSKPSSISKGVGGHEHIQGAVDSMRVHLHEADSLCTAGNEHEALLHLNVIRAFLELPEFKHPTSHHYLYQDKK